MTKFELGSWSEKWMYVYVKSIKSMDEKKIASFYFNKEDNCTHLTGFVYALNDSELLVAHINARRGYDGFALNHINNLYRVD